MRRSLALAIVVALSVPPISVVPALAENLEAVCKLSGGTISGKKYISLRCAAKSAPNDWLWSTRAFEGESNYKKWSVDVGKRFKCRMVGFGATLKLQDCAPL